MSNESENKNENEYMRLLKAVDDGIDHHVGKYDISEDPSDLTVTWDDDTFFVAYLRPDIVHAIQGLFRNASE